MNEREQIIKSIDNIKGQMDSLSALLTQEQERLEAVQSAEPWKPKDMDKYWYVCTDGELAETVNLRTYIDRDLINSGNCFQTELEAKRHAAKMKFMFRRCPEIVEGKRYYCLTPRGMIDYSDGYVPHSNTFRTSQGNVYATKEEAEEWLPLYKFAFLGGDCPEGF